ncbi:MAG TPA: shikimate kinase AroK [Nevskiaceae bacterium]|nr:shikimate kinase AroK [Nevskiaceae bacterium]
MPRLLAIGSAMIGSGRNIFLVGPMGSGKTTVGRHLARAAALEFVDSDQEIEARTGVDIPYIFEREGEARFRAREEQTLADLVQREAIVLATGGGAVLNADTRRRLAAHGCVIYLHATVAQQIERTAHCRNRPLLRGVDREATLARLLEQRDPLYREVADLIVDIRRCSAHALALQILRQIAQAEADQMAYPCAAQQ